MSSKKHFKGFERGLSRLRIADFDQAREEIMAAIGINNRVSWFEYKTGRRELKIGQAKAVEEVFKKYGITDIWR